PTRLERGQCDFFLVLPVRIDLPNGRDEVVGRAAKQDVCTIDDVLCLIVVKQNIGQNSTLASIQVDRRQVVVVEVTIEQGGKKNVCSVARPARKDVFRAVVRDLRKARAVCVDDIQFYRSAHVVTKNKLLPIRRVVLEPRRVLRRRQSCHLDYITTVRIHGVELPGTREMTSESDP